MRNHKAWTQCYAPLLAIAVAGCAGINAPRGSVPMAQVAAQDPFGGWAAVWTDKSYRPTFEGELIAVGPDSVFVLSGDTLVARPMSGVRRVRVVGYNPKAADLMNWTLVGTLSTASHGLIAFLSAPVWLLVGSITTSSAAYASELNAPGHNHSWDDLRAYSRFPQGIPVGIDRANLRGRVPQQPDRH
ncbi:MAG: hypothetical protein ABI613_01635 [Gemmatimonadota bacterium]